MKSHHLILSFLAIANSEVFFSETFDEGWEANWVLGKGKDAAKMGKWTIATGKWFRDKSEDRGLHTSETMKNYAIAASFPSFSNEGRELIIQYQVKYEKDLSCGGGYLKLGPRSDDLATFGEETPYNIMFGPDQCNADKRTQLIFSYKGANYPKKSDLPFKQEGQGISHLYRLHMKTDGSVSVEVDQEVIYNGLLKADWDMLPNATIVDSNDKKPADWADESMIDDPEDKKPADWVDEKRIVDPESAKPAEWDEEEDGEWEPPKIDNPAFKGTWTAKKVANPAYKGIWEPRKIANPEFEDDPDVYKYQDFGFVGFDIWQVKGGTIFDNIIITDSVAEADQFAAKWKALREHEADEQKNEEARLAEVFEKSRAARAKRAAEMKAADEAKAALDKIKGDTKENEEL